MNLDQLIYDEIKQHNMRRRHEEQRQNKKMRRNLEQQRERNTFEIERIRSNFLESQLRIIKSDEEMKIINNHINQLISLKQLEIREQKALKKLKDEERELRDRSERMRKEIEREKAANAKIFWLIMTIAFACFVYFKQQISVKKVQKTEATQAKVVETVKSTVNQSVQRESVFEQGKMTAKFQKKRRHAAVKRKDR